MICPYCNQEASLVDSSKVYGKSYGLIYLCSNYPNCDAYVGVHKGTKNPLGRMANKELRYWKKKAHAAFDPLWKKGVVKRSFAYLLLSKKLSILHKDAHIGLFDIEKCKKVVDIFTNIKEEELA